MKMEFNRPQGFEEFSSEAEQLDGLENGIDNIDDFNPDMRIADVGIADEAPEIELFSEGEILAVLDIRDQIADELGIYPPELSFYYSPNEYDGGGFSGEYNIISLNMRNIDNPESLLGTLAHEMRHAWQHERACLPDELQTDLDRALKFNFDNYISPYDNYEGYRNQLIEVDARTYAEDYMERLFGDYRY